MEGYKVLSEIHVKPSKKSDVNINFKRPEIIGIFTSNGVEFTPSPSLRYFKEPRSQAFPLDLNKGYEQYKGRNDNYFKSNLKIVEKYLMDGGSNASENGPNELDKIYTQRSALYHIMLIPYVRHNDFITLATKFGDNIYLAHYEDEESNQRPPIPQQTHAFKLRQYCFADSVTAEPNTDLPVDENFQTYAVYRSQLNQFDVVYTAEVQGIKSDEDIQDLSDLEELNKTRFIFANQKPKGFERRDRDLKWWIQAYLANVTEFYVASKDPNGLVRSPLKQVFVKDLSEQLKVEPRKCANALHDYLSSVQDAIREVNSPYTVYKFHFNSSKRELSYKVHEGKTELSFLSEQFVEHLNEKTAP